MIIFIETFPKHIPINITLSKAQSSYLCNKVLVSLNKTKLQCLLFLKKLFYYVLGTLF